MKTKLHLKILILFATIVSFGCSEKRKKESQVSEDGFSSPELVFEAIKGNELEFEIPLYPPADRNVVAYLNVEMLSLMVTMEEDLDRKKEAEQAFSALIEKYDLTDRLEFTDQEDKKESLAEQAFEGVDLTAFLADVKSFMTTHGSSFFGTDDEGEKVEALSLKNLQVDGDDATATMIYSDDTERPAIFVREEGRWYLSFEGMYEDQIEGGFSMSRTLKITFSTDADLEEATAKKLLKDVEYDRSMAPTLNKTAEDRVAYLEFAISLDSTVKIEAILDRVGKVSGVESVAPTFGAEYEAESEEARIRALNSPIPSGAISMGCILKITFATDDDLERATAKSLLEGLSEDLGMDATLDKKAKDRVAYLEFMKSLDSDIEPILERIGKVPGVVAVNQSLGAEFDESPERSHESEADLAEQEDPPTTTAPEMEQPSPEPDAGTPDKPANEAPVDMIAERVWIQDRTGKTLTAALVSVDAGVGAFRRDNGKSFNYAIKNLSAADRKLIEEAKLDLEEKAKPTAARPDQEGHTLTVEQTTAAIRKLGCEAGVGRARKNGDYKFRGGPDLVRANFASSPITDAGLAGLKDLTRIWSLDLGGTETTDRGLEHLKGLIHLESLGLIGTSVTDAGMAHLEELTNLAVLHLASTGVTDAGLVHLRELTRLDDLHFGGTRVGDAGLASLEGLKNLRLLHLGGTQITDAGLAHLKTLAGLEQLTLEHTGITDAGLEHLRGLAKLYWLGLAETAVTDAGLEHLQGMPRLKRIDIGGTKIGDAGLAHLRGMELDLLHLTYTGVTDAGLAHLQEMTNMKWMSIGGTQISDAGLAHLKRMTQLRTLELSGTKVTDAGLEHLKGLTRLEKLELRDTAVTDAGVENLQMALPKCKIQR